VRDLHVVGEYRLASEPVGRVSGSVFAASFWLIAPADVKVALTGAATTVISFCMGATGVNSTLPEAGTSLAISKV
jgi:hypothetical protein